MGEPARVPVHYTVSDWETWEGDWELVYGQPVAMVAPALRHQWISYRLTRQLMDQFETCEKARCLALQEVAWEVAEDTVLVPDLVVVCDEDLDQRRLVRTPEMVVEIVSPNTARLDETVKFEICAREGVRYFVLVYPEKRLAKIWHLREGRYHKEGDFREGGFLFRELTCPARLDFENLWVDPR